MRTLRGTDCRFDRPSPFEAERVHNPAPDMSLVNAALAARVAAVPTEGHLIAQA